MNNDTKLLKIIEMCNFFLYIFSTNLIPPTGYVLFVFVVKVKVVLLAFGLKAGRVNSLRIWDLRRTMPLRRSAPCSGGFEIRQL